jgi:hypothetical protein
MRSEKSVADQGKAGRGTSSEAGGPHEDTDAEGIDMCDHYILADMTAEEFRSALAHGRIANCAYCMRESNP